MWKNWIHNMVKRIHNAVLLFELEKQTDANIDYYSLL